MSETTTKCLHCGKDTKLAAFACHNCGMPFSVDPDNIFNDKFLDSIPLEDHLKTKPFTQILEEESIEKQTKRTE